jgi:hypothetical protein
MASVLALALKTIFNEFVLERLPIIEQLDLFNDGSAEFKQMKFLFTKQYG